MNHQCSIHHKDAAMYLENEKKTKIVAAISVIAMIVEIVVGYWSGSMALLADGWHMASHTLALGLTLVVYYLYRLPKFRQAFTFGGGKILSLGGYTSALILVLISFSMIYESFHRFFHQEEILFNEAILVSVIGLVINVISVLILHKESHTTRAHHCSEHHHDHHNHHDHNHLSAYAHILADAFTSVLAIIALVLGKFYNLNSLDSIVGVLGGVVVLKWSFNLIKDSAKDLLDAHDYSIDKDQLVKLLELDGSRVIDIHLWKLSPSQSGCEIIVESVQNHKSSYYKDKILSEFKIHHLIIEVV
jgi:cation diffusion facilitator family transporter